MDIKYWLGLKLFRNILYPVPDHPVEVYSAVTLDSADVTLMLTSLWELI